MLQSLSFIKNFTTLELLLFIFWFFCLIGFTYSITYVFVLNIKNFYVKIRNYVR
jgi:hypothetical protein